MKNKQIRSLLHKNIPVGMIFKNPGGGTSAISGITDDYIYYIRGKSKLSLPIQEFIDICTTYDGKKCSTSDLKQYKAIIFDSNKNGHSCNCTFLFCLAQQLGFTNGEILGRGVRGNPFYIAFKSIF